MTNKTFTLGVWASFAVFCMLQIAECAGNVLSDMGYFLHESYAPLIVCTIWAYRGLVLVFQAASVAAVLLFVDHALDLQLFRRTKET